MKRTMELFPHGPDWQTVRESAQSGVTVVVGSADEVTEPLAKSTRVVVERLEDYSSAVFSLPLKSRPSCHTRLCNPCL